MIQSVRNQIGPILDRARRQGSRDNLSLYLNKLCRSIDNPKEHDAKEYTLQSLLRGYSTDTMALYRNAFEEWRSICKTNRNTLCFEMETITPLIVGKGDQNIHEFGITLQAPWGTPVIPGTAVKGVLSSFAAYHGGEDWQKSTGRERGGQYGLAMFGGIDKQHHALAGGIRFMDAWWIPGKPEPFMEDIINVHYPSYYQKGQWPHGMDSPIPNKFLAIRPKQRFLFVFKGPAEWYNLAREILKDAANEQGFGAKTRVGYGRLRYCKTDQDIQEEIHDLDDTELAERFASHGGSHNLRERFADECQRREYSTGLHKLFINFRPAAVLLDTLRSKRPLTWKEAGTIRKQYDSQLPAGKIDPTDPDIQAIFTLCMPLAPNRVVTGTWLARFAPAAEDIIAKRNPVEIESLLFDYSVTWPPLKDFRSAIENHPHLSEKERADCLLALDLKLREK